MEGLTALHPGSSFLRHLPMMGGESKLAQERKCNGLFVQDLMMEAPHMQLERQGSVSAFTTGLLQTEDSPCSELEGAVERALGRYVEHYVG